MDVVFLTCIIAFPFLINDYTYSKRYGDINKITDIKISANQKRQQINVTFLFFRFL